MDLNKDKLESIQAIITTAAILLGAWVGWSKFLTGRVYHHRAEPSVSGAVTYQGNVPHLLVTAKVTNIGQSKIDLLDGSCRLKVFAAKKVANPVIAERIRWKEQRTTGIFEGQKKLESGEVLEEQVLIVLPPDDYAGFRVEISISSRENWWQANFKRTTWGANAIVTTEKVPV